MNETNNPSHKPLITPKFAWRVAFVVAILLIVTLIIHLGGKYFSDSIVKAGHTDDQQIYSIIMGENTLNVAANTIRFDSQRRNGVADGVKLYLSWPEMAGYSDVTKNKFNDTGGNSSLIFIDIGYSNNQVDMSSRFEPIYRNFIQGAPNAGPNGLVFYRMSPQSSYSGEILYTENITKERPYVIKCLQNKPGDTANSAGCQRDINIGKGLRLTYRFSEAQIAQWRSIEEQVLTFAQQIIK
jgi:hypothetical protein